MLKKTQNKLISCILIISFIAILPCGCTGIFSSAPKSADFGNICSTIMTHILESDGLACAYSLMHPENYGINERPVSLGHFTKEAEMAEYSFYENILKSLDDLDVTKLSKDDMLTNKILRKCIENTLAFSDYYLYSEPFSPVNGIQSSIPLLLAEYQFYDETYVDTYLKLLSNVSSYIDEAIAYEHEKIEAGLGMSAEQADIIIEQCNEFMENNDDNVLISTFADRLDELDNISEEEKDNYQKSNLDVINSQILPAYKRITDTLNEIKDNNSTPVTRGLAAISDTAKAYYTSLVKYQTCSDKSPREMYNMLEETLRNCTKHITDIIKDNPGILSKSEALISPVISDGEGSFSAEKTITYLKEQCGNSFPLPSVDHAFKVKAVPDSLEDMLSPAMYFVPPIDGDLTDRIYINAASCNKGDIFYTLAHESYPGHMYQTRYFMDSEPDTIRLLLNWGGYSEGWATYAELFSYSYDGLDPAVSDVQKYNKLATLCLYSLADIGIHYYGWTLKDCRKLFKKNNITDADTVGRIYLTVASEPALYTKYTFGCIEFLNELDFAKNKLKDRFNIIDYHDYLLKLGPMPFDILHKEMNLWYNCHE